jgi:hypothetical protein
MGNSSLPSPFIVLTALQYVSPDALGHINLIVSLTDFLATQGG